MSEGVPMARATREARVIYPGDWPWPGQPWPWCWKAEREREYWGDQARAAIPHDHHMVNEGNTMCPGAPGEIEDEGTR